MSLWGGMIGALVGVAAVLGGTWLRIPGFCPDTGYWGAKFLNSMFYAMGSDRTAVAIVCVLWGFYGATLGALPGLLRGRRGEKPCRP